MRTKALVLGALPVPFEGPWVPIAEVKVWRCRVMTQPREINLRGELSLEVMLSNGSVTPIPVLPETEIAGEMARVILSREIDDVRHLTVILEEVR